MQLRLRTKLTLVMTGLVLLVVVAVSRACILRCSYSRFSIKPKSEPMKSPMDLLSKSRAPCATPRPRDGCQNPTLLKTFATMSSYASRCEPRVARRNCRQLALASSIYEVSITEHQGKVLASAPDKSSVENSLRAGPAADATHASWCSCIR